MNIDKALILRLEKLARLKLSETERTEITEDLEKILTMVEQLESIDTEGVEPLRYMNTEPTVWRVDEVNHPITREEALKNAPERNEAFIKVPKIIEKED